MVVKPWMTPQLFLYCGPYPCGGVLPETAHFFPLVCTYWAERTWRGTHLPSPPKVRKRRRRRRWRRKRGRGWVKRKRRKRKITLGMEEERQQQNHS